MCGGFTGRKLGVVAQWRDRFRITTPYNRRIMPAVSEKRMVFLTTWRLWPSLPRSRRRRQLSQPASAVGSRAPDSNLGSTCSKLQAPHPQLQPRPRPLVAIFHRAIASATIAHHH